MATTLYVRNVPDETSAALKKLAEEEGTNVSEYVRRVLEDVAAREVRRRAMASADEDLDAILAEVDLSRIMPGDGARAVRAARDEYGRGDTP